MKMVKTIDQFSPNIFARAIREVDSERRLDPKDPWHGDGALGGVSRATGVDFAA